MNQEEFLKEARTRALEVTKRTGSTDVLVQFTLCYKGIEIDDISDDEWLALGKMESDSQQSIEELINSADVTYKMLGAEPLDPRHPKEGHFLLLSLRAD